MKKCAYSSDSSTSMFTHGKQLIPIDSETITIYMLKQIRQCVTEAGVNS